MIDDVQSFVKIAEVLKERGAYKIYAMATHGLLSSDAPRLIEDSYIDEVSPLIWYCGKLCNMHAVVRYAKSNSYRVVHLCIDRKNDESFKFLLFHC